MAGGKLDPIDRQILGELQRDGRMTNVELAEMLPSRCPSHPDFRRYPTAATLVVDFDIPAWADLKPGQGSTLDFFVPSGRD